MYPEKIIIDDLNFIWFDFFRIINFNKTVKKTHEIKYHKHYTFRKILLITENSTIKLHL